MEWSAFIPAIPAMIRTSYNIYKSKKDFNFMVIKFLAWVDKGSTDIAILGTAGVGKTILSRCLHGQSPEYNYKIPGVSTSVESNAIPFREKTKLVRVIPGQGSSARDIGINEAFHGNKSLEGVIYVVDWGYTKPRDRNTQALLEDSEIDSIEKLREYNLRREIEDIGRLAEDIKRAHSNGNGPKWLIIAVNKVDLFFDRIDEVQKYYSIQFDSEFTKILKDMVKYIGEKNIFCETLPISVWPEDFMWKNELIKTNIGGKEIEHGLAINFINRISEQVK